MPDYDPPSQYDGNPNRYLLPPNTTLWRVHHKSRKATDFDAYRERERSLLGRFDGTAQDPYPAYGAGLDASSTIAEILLRNVPARGQYRTVRRVSVEGMRASIVATAVELTLVSLLSSVDLAAVAQDVWLIRAQDCRNPRIGLWASWIRQRARWAEGFLWPLGCDGTRHAVVLFGDRCGGEVLDPNVRWDVDLDDSYGAHWLNSVLAQHGARIKPPRR